MSCSGTEVSTMAPAMSRLEIGPRISHPQETPIDVNRLSKDIAKVVAPFFGYNPLVEKLAYPLATEVLAATEHGPGWIHRVPARVYTIPGGPQETILMPFPILIAPQEDGSKEVTLLTRPRGDAGKGMVKTVSTMPGFRVTRSGEVFPSAKVILQSDPTQPGYGNIVQGINLHTKAWKALGSESLFPPPVEVCPGVALQAWAHGDLRRAVTMGGFPEQPYAGAEWHSLSFLDILECFRGIAAGAEKLHSKGLVHRDVKQENALLMHDPGSLPTARLSDFDLSAPIGAGMFRPGAPYFAWDWIANKGKCEPSTDCFGLAMLILDSIFPGWDDLLRPVSQKPANTDPAAPFFIEMLQDPERQNEFIIEILKSLVHRCIILADYKFSGLSFIDYLNRKPSEESSDTPSLSTGFSYTTPDGYIAAVKGLIPTTRKDLQPDLEALVVQLQAVASLCRLALDTFMATDQIRERVTSCKRFSQYLDSNDPQELRVGNKELLKMMPSMKAMREKLDAIQEQYQRDLETARSGKSS